MKHTLFVAVAVVLCALCSSCNKDAACYLKWTPSVIFGDAAVQTSMIDSVCNAVVTEKGYAVAGERMVNLNTTNGEGAKTKMTEFNAAVEKGLLNTGRFTQPVLDGNGDPTGQTCYITYEVCKEVSKGTDKVKTTTSDLEKAEYTFK